MIFAEGAIYLEKFNGWYSMKSQFKTGFSILKLPFRKSKPAAQIFFSACKENKTGG